MRPVLKRVEGRSVVQKRRIEDYFICNERVAKVKSERLQKAIKDIVGIENEDMIIKNKGKRKIYEK